MDTMSSVAVNVTGPLVAGTGSDDSPSGYDISGLVISIVGSITLLQAIYTGLQRIFPEKRLKLLDDTLEETIRMYAMALEDGIFEDASKLKSIEHSLLKYAWQFMLVDLWYDLTAFDTAFAGIRTPCVQKCTWLRPSRNNSMLGGMVSLSI